MKRVKILMDNGEVYYFQSEFEDIRLERALDLFYLNGKPKENWILMTGESQNNRLVIVPSHVSSLQEEEY